MLKMSDLSKLFRNFQAAASSRFTYFMEKAQTAAFQSDNLDGPFEAIVLSNPQSTEGVNESENSLNWYTPVYVRLMKTDDLKLPDPFQAIKNPNLTTAEEKADKFLKIVSMHPIAYPSTQFLGQSTESDFGQGTIVEVEYMESAPEHLGRERGLVYTKIVGVSPAFQNAGFDIPDSYASSFDFGNPTLLGDAHSGPLAFDAAAALRFMKRLRALTVFNGYSDAALAGIAANAAAESAFNHDAHGDPSSIYADQTKALRNIDGNCSHGFFQLNVCPEDGAGFNIAKDKGWISNGQWTQTGRESFGLFISQDNGAQQLTYIAQKLSTFGIATTDPKAFASKMTLDFERPKNKEIQAERRAEAAQKIYDAYIADKGTP